MSSDEKARSAKKQRPRGRRRPRAPRPTGSRAVAHRALQALDRYAELSSEDRASRAGVLAGLGRNAEARQLLDESIALEDNYDDPARIAIAYARLGDLEAAFTWLERAVESSTWVALWVGMDTDFDPMRSDPRFAEVMRRTGLDRFWPEGG